VSSVNPRRPLHSWRREAPLLPLLRQRKSVLWASLSFAELTLSLSLSSHHHQRTHLLDWGPVCRAQHLELPHRHWHLAQVSVGLPEEGYPLDLPDLLLELEDHRLLELSGDSLGHRRVDFRELHLPAGSPAGLRLNLALHLQDSRHHRGACLRDSPLQGSQRRKAKVADSPLGSVDNKVGRFTCGELSSSLTQVTSAIYPLCSLENLRVLYFD